MASSELQPPDELLPGCTALRFEHTKFHGLLLTVQSAKLAELEQYKAGNIGEALVQAFLGMDEIMMKEESWEQLKQLAGEKVRRAANR